MYHSPTPSPVGHAFPPSIGAHARGLPESQHFGGAVFPNTAAVHAQPAAASSTSTYGYGHGQGNWAPSELRSAYGSEFDYGQGARHDAVPSSYAPSTGDVGVGPLSRAAPFPLTHTHQDGARFDLQSSQGAYRSHDHMLPPTAPSREHVNPHGLYGVASDHVKQEIKQEDQPIPWPAESGGDPRYDVEHDRPFEDARDQCGVSEDVMYGAQYHADGIYVKAELPATEYCPLGYADDEKEDMDPISPQEGFGPDSVYHNAYPHASPAEACYEKHPQYESDLQTVHEYYDGYSSSSASYADSPVIYVQDEYESPLASPSTDDPYYYQRPAFQHNRSYTLEAAMIPVHPPPAPLPAVVPSPSPTPVPVSPHRSPTPAPAPTRSRPVMDSLPLPDEASMAELERGHQAFLHAKGKPSAHPQLHLQTQPPLQPPSQPPPVRRPRGRPRKHPLPTRSSPPPPVDYPYPQFPPASAEAQAASSSNRPDQGHPEHDHRYMDHLPSPSQVPVPMSLDEVPMPDSEDRPGQAIFKLNTPNGPKDPVKKKPIMACLFCRERKIACGPPAPESPERRCNQCARRGLICEYPKESRRGQHKRGPRAARVQALADAAAMSESAVAVAAASTEGGLPMTVDPIVDALAGTSSVSGCSGGMASSVSGQTPVPRPRPGKERERSSSSSQCAREVVVEKKTAQRAHQQRKALPPHVALKSLFSLGPSTIRSPV